MRLTPAGTIMIMAIVALLLSGCATAPIGSSLTNPGMADGARVGKPVQCVPYARDVSGIDLYGDAYSWWDKAAPTYRRGQTPAPGAVLVLSRTDKMRSGHVAVVKQVISPRQIDVTHSNWGNDRQSRSIIYHSMRVEDLSGNNDWTRVRFWNAELDCFGLPYSARGFIYP